MSAQHRGKQRKRTGAAKKANSTEPGRKPGRKPGQRLDQRLDQTPGTPQASRKTSPTGTPGTPGRGGRSRTSERDRGGGSDQADLITLDIHDLATGGDGVGRIEPCVTGDRAGLVAFVAYSAPGERVRAQVYEQKKRYLRAEAIEVLAPAAERVEPMCSLFRERTCGGCQWQHLSPAAQAQAKERAVRNELRHQIGRGMTLLPIIADVPPYGWRRRARFHAVRPTGSDRALIGLFAPRSHRVTDVPECPQLEPALAAVLDLIRAELSPLVHGRAEIELVAGTGGKVHMAIRGAVDARAAAALVGKHTGAGTIAGITMVSRDQSGETRRLSLGAENIEIEPGLRGRADLFAQGSRAGNQALLEAVDQAAGPRGGMRVLELHAGTGNLTRVIARGARALVATDSHPPPWRNDMLRGPADEVLRTLIGRAMEPGMGIDLVVLDPPRTGAAEVMAPLIELRPPRIVYVSCDPATLARDLAVLAEPGYQAVHAQPLDLMPQTAHVEVVVRLDALPD